jgi:hypothetical protein
VASLGFPLTAGLALSGGLPVAPVAEAQPAARSITTTTGWSVRSSSQSIRSSARAWLCG